MSVKKQSDESFVNGWLKRLASLKITVVLLGMSFLLVFFGTLAQVELGIGIATIQFFRSWWVFWQPESLPVWKLPIVLPGAWTLGALLLINLTAALVLRFRWQWAKAGLLLSHMGVIVLLAGELMTGVFQVETYLQLDEGETRSFTVSRDESELAVRRIDTEDSATVFAFDVQLLAPGQTLEHEALPFRLQLEKFVPNARLAVQQSDETWRDVDASLGVGSTLFYQELPRETELNHYDQPLAIARIVADDEEIGTLMLSPLLATIQQVTVDGESYEIALRHRRYAYPFSFTLIDFRHDRYPGTDKPKNFSSRLRLVNEESSEDREVLIKMNEPLRYAGLSFYQHSFDNADTTTILQVVRNPARWVPYIACAMVFGGLLWHFFLRMNRRPTSKSAATARTTKETSVKRPSWHWAVAGLPALALVAAFLFSLLPEERSTFDTATFGKIPVLSNGRIQPIDSLARNSLIILSGKGKLRTENGTLSATEWLAELSAQPELAADRAVFLLDNKEIKGQLGLDETQRLFSFKNLTEHRDVAGRHLHPLEVITEQARKASELDAKARNAYQRDILQLFNQLWLYRSLINSLRPEDTRHFPEEIAAFSARIDAGVDEFRKRKAGESFNRDTIVELETFVQRYQRLSDAARFFAIPPHQSKATVEEWQSMGEALVDSVRGDGISPVVPAYAQALHGFRHNEPATFNENIAAVYQYAQQHRPEEAAKAMLEYRFNRAAPFAWARVGYVVGLLLALFSLLFAPRILRDSAMLVVLVSFVLHTGGIATRMIIEDRPPVTNLYSSAIFIGWGTVLLAVFLERVSRRGLVLAGACLVGFSTLMIAHYLSLQGDTLEMMQAVLDSNFWLGTHVVVVTLGYSAMFAAGVLGIVWLIWRLIAQKENTPGLREFSGMIYGVTCFALLFSFTGTVLGGIWADQSWGRFWGWDPKENGALLIVLWTAIIIHARMAGLIRMRGTAAMAVFGNVITSWSWFGTNMLGIGLHSYGFTDAASITLYAFVLSQCLLIGLAFIPISSRKETARSLREPVLHSS